MEESLGLDVNSAAGVFLICPKTRRTLLGLRSPEGGHEGNTWCTFGGMMQNCETPLEGALRELLEESEVRPNNTIKKALYVDQQMENNGFNFYTFLGISDDEVVPVINDEHIDYHWFRLSELKDLELHSGLQRMLSDVNAMNIINNKIIS